MFLRIDACIQLTGVLPAVIGKPGRRAPIRIKNEGCRYCKLCTYRHI